MSKVITFLLSVIIILILVARLISNTSVKPLVGEQHDTQEVTASITQASIVDSDKPSNAAIKDDPFTIDSFNRLSKQELMRFPGIGEVTSQAILDYIEVNGPFNSFDEIIKVKGIGVKKLEKILSNLP